MVWTYSIGLYRQKRISQAGGEGIPDTAGNSPIKVDVGQQGSSWNCCKKLLQNTSAQILCCCWWWSPSVTRQVAMMERTVPLEERRHMKERESNVWRHGAWVSHERMEDLEFATWSGGRSEWRGRRWFQEWWDRLRRVAMAVRPMREYQCTGILARWDGYPEQHTSGSVVW